MCWLGEWRGWFGGRFGGPGRRILWTVGNVSTDIVEGVSIDVRLQVDISC